MKVNSSLGQAEAGLSAGLSSLPAGRSGLFSGAACGSRRLPHHLGTGSEALKSFSVNSSGVVSTRS